MRIAVTRPIDLGRIERANRALLLEQACYDVERRLGTALGGEPRYVITFSPQYSVVSEALRDQYAEAGWEATVERATWGFHLVLRRPE